MTWVLVLLSTYHWSHNISSTPIEGFTTEKACYNAGERVKYVEPQVKFVCIYKGDR